MEQKKEKKNFDDLPDRLQKAYKAREEKTKGSSPKKIGEEKAKFALNWVYRWGWASPSTLDILGNSARRGLAARLVKRGLLKAIRTESGGAVKGVPAFVLTLADTGVAEVERHFDDPSNFMPYEQNPWRAVQQDLLRHDQLTQLATSKALIGKTIKAFQTPKEFVAKSADGIKQPDAVWILASGEQIGVEVELTQKHDRALDQFVRGCLLSLASLNNQPARFQFIALITDSKGITKNYKTALAAGAKYSLWEKNQRGYWVTKGEPKVVSEAFADKFMWRLIEDEKKKKEEKLSEPLR